MPPHDTDEELRELLTALLAIPTETEWLEFKSSMSDPERIGRYISGLANTAALLNRTCGYLIWGVEDGTHKVIGTDFNPKKSKIKGQELELWLTLAVPACEFSFSTFTYDDKVIVILRVEAAVSRPAECHSKPYVRVGTSLTELRNDTAREGRLWDILRNRGFEQAIAREALTGEQVLRALDVEVFFERTRTAMPSSTAEVLAVCENLGLVTARDDGRWDVTNLGALTFARKLSDFPSVASKAVIVVQYEGNTRNQVLRRQEGGKGYGVGFLGLLGWLKALLPAREVYIDGERIEQVVYTDLLLREVIANAMIHQDLTVRGAAPRVEVFADRIEVTNPGDSLVETDRLINHPSLSRNPVLADLMRRMRLCEVNGTGWDRITMETEAARLPSPVIDMDADSMRVTVLGPRKLTAMTRDQQLWAVYTHACLQFATQNHLTNSSLRERFGIAPGNSSQVSRLIASTIEDGLIVLYDEKASLRNRSYVPYWAKAGRRAPISI